jgi:hypothetical protein
MRRSQHAVNYTTTIVIALGIVAGVLIAFYALVDQDADVNTRCQLNDQLVCDDDNVALSAAENTIRFIVANAGAQPIQVSNATARIDQDIVGCAAADIIEPDGETTITCSADLVAASPYNIPLTITYHDVRRSPTFSSTTQGSLQGRATNTLLDALWTPTQQTEDALTDYLSLADAENVLSDQNVYITTSTGGLLTYDNDTTPINNHGFIADIDSRGNDLYLASQDGFQRYRKNPNTSLQTAYDMNASPRSLSIQGSRAYYLDDDDGIIILKRQGQTYTEQNTYKPSYFPYVISEYNGGLLAGGTDGLHLYQATGFTLSEATNDTTTTQPITDLATTSTHAYAVESATQLISYKVDTSPPTVQTTSYYANEVVPEAVTNDDTTVFLAGQGGVEIIDASNPSSPQQIDYYPVEGTCTDVAVDDQTIYVTGCGSGFVALERPLTT